MRKPKIPTDVTFVTHWFRPFTMRLTSPCFPSLLYLNRATICSRQYRSDGAKRINDNYGLFHYALGGNGIFRDGNKEYRITAGQGFLCRMNDPKTAYYAVADGDFHWESLGVMFLGTTAMLLMEDLVKRHGPVFDVPLHSALIERFLTIGESQHILSVEDSSQLVFVLLQTLESLGRAENDTTPELMRRAVKMIEERSATAFNVSDLSLALRVSREHLTRRMRATMGTTPLDIIRRKKIEAACGWLLETRLTVKEISSRLGYASPVAFINMFRKYMKTNPTIFRRKGHLR